VIKMVKKNYNFSFEEGKKYAKAFATNLPVSLKFAVELCRELKGKKLNKAEKYLQDIIEFKRYLPLRKYNTKVGHRKGNATSFTKSGRYPVKLCKAVLKLFKSVKANADYIGLNMEKLQIEHMFASKGFRRYSHQKQGRIAGKIHRKKSTHIEVVVSEAA